jgi:hypothetical protein
LEEGMVAGAYSTFLNQRKNHLTVVIDGEEATVLRMNEKGVQEQTVLVPLGSNQFLEKVVTDGSIPGVVSHYFWSFYMAKKRWGQGCISVLKSNSDWEVSHRKEIYL